MPLQVRRGTTTDRTSITPLIGEIIYDTSEKVLYVGDGNTPGGIAATAFTFEDAQDATANLFTTGIHSNINFNYNDVAARIDASVDLTSYNGAIAANSFKGNVLDASDNILIDATLGSFQLDGTVRSNVVPFASETYDLGSPTNKFKDLYLSGASLYLGDARITASGTAINLPAGSTIGGNSIATSIGEGLFPGDIKGSVFGQDSSVIIDATNNQIRGNFIGRLGGDLDVNNFKIVGGTVELAPTSHTIIGSQSLLKNGSLSILRFGYSGGGYGTNTPLRIAQISTNSQVDKQIFVRSRTLGANLVPVNVGDVIGEIAFVGETMNPFNGSQFSAAIRAVVDDTLTGNIAPGRIDFLTNSGLGLTTKCQITNDGILKVRTIEARIIRQLSNESFGLTVEGNLVGDVTGSVFADDSTMLVDSTNGRFIGNLDGDVTGSVYSDDSTKIVDGTNGSITAGSFVQFGSLTTTQRNALTAVNGMVIYNTTNNRFEGHQNGVWINLDDGTPAGV